MNNNAPQFNWNDFLAIKYDDITDDQTREARARASSWVTCAVGDRCKDLPRAEHGSVRPADNDLRTLGLLFSNAVGGMHRQNLLRDEPLFNYYQETAQDILARIEARTALLLAQQCQP